MVQLSLWGLLSQEGEASLRQPLLRELLRLPALPRLLELPLSLLLVIRRHGSRQQAAGSRQQGLRSRPLPRLAQDEERRRTCGEARGRRGLGKMTRRKREITGLANEQDFPHLVELGLPPGGFRSVFLEIDAFHRDRRIPVRRRRSRHEAEQSRIPFCFPDTATADAFPNRFGGECLTYALGKPKPRT